MPNQTGRLRNVFVAIILCAGSAGSLSGQTPDDSLISVGKYRLHFRVHRAGAPTILLESGGGLDASQWDDVAPRLVQETGATVVAYDRAGYGKSDLPEEPYDIRHEVAGMWSGLQQLGLSKSLLLVGHSYGGLLIQLTAHEHKDAMLGLVFVDPNLVSFVDEMGGPEGLNRLMKLFGPAPQPKPAGRRQLEGFPSTLSIVRDSPLPSSIPVRVITSGRPWWPTGEANQAFRAAHERLARSVADGKLVVAEKSGHMITRTQPELIVEVVSALLHSISKP